MKITQEVREFARLQEQKISEDASSPAESSAEEGMAEMSKRFEEAGREIYIPAQE
jgi:phosphomethylpyrimidine synthase